MWHTQFYLNPCGTIFWIPNTEVRSWILQNSKLRIPKQLLKASEDSFTCAKARVEFLGAESICVVGTRSSDQYLTWNIYKSKTTNDYSQLSKNQKRVPTYYNATLKMKQLVVFVLYSKIELVQYMNMTWCIPIK